MKNKQKGGPTMLEITIDADVCQKDGACAMACTRDVFRQEETGTMPKIVGLERCFGCGQCVAICPQGAISHSGFPEGTVTPIRPEHVPTYDHVLELIRSRRSKRLFKQRPVDRDVIEKVLEAARFAPSGHNEQSTEFVVIQDEQILQEIAILTAEGLANLVQPLGNPIGTMMMRRAMGRRGTAYLAELAPELEHLVALFYEGTDWILREPPVLVLFCADSAGEFFARVNASLALHNAALAAETLGLGCYYTGFVVIACDRDDRIARLVGLPETHQIYGALAMGYPRLKFNKWPERNPARVTWLEAA
jgi:nitroreductase/NAD-dependent dihydropyrimidine dehydrogenase PreA subunit